MKNGAPEEISQMLIWKSLNIVNKHVFICCNPYIYTTVVQEVYNRDRSPELDVVEGLAGAATKHLELLKQKDEAERSYAGVYLHQVRLILWGAVH